MDADDIRTLQAARSGAIAYLRERGDHKADFDACALALSELIGNAIRHGPGGPVTVRLDWSQALPKLSVCDAGVGFRMRIELPPSGSEGGRGLFLIEQLIGTPVVTSGAGGCTVSVTLPVPRRNAPLEIKASA